AKAGARVHCNRPPSLGAVPNRSLTRTFRYRRDACAARNPPHTPGRHSRMTPFDSRSRRIEEAHFANLAAPILFHPYLNVAGDPRRGRRTMPESRVIF